MIPNINHYDSNYICEVLCYLAYELQKNGGNVK